MKTQAKEKYYRMTFSIGEVTEKEIKHVRDVMQKLEKHDGIMRCFQNIDRATIKSKDQQSYFSGRNEGSDFTIYYREGYELKLDKLLFKLKLKFPEFAIQVEQTLQSYI